MNHKLTAIVAMLLIAPALGRAQNASDGGAVVTCEVRMIEAPRAEVNKLLPNTGYVIKEPVLQQLQEWVNQKKAVILAQPRVVTVSGAQAQVRAVRELIYPAEFDLKSKATTETHGTNVTIKATEQTAPNQTILFPVGFKTRELGALLNITPTVSGQKNEWINLTLIPELSQLSKIGFVKHEMLTAGGKTEISQPDVYSWNATTSVVLKSGSTVLIAVLDPVANDQYQAHDNVVLVLLTAAVNRAE